MSFARTCPAAEDVEIMGFQTESENSNQQKDLIQDFMDVDAEDKEQGPSYFPIYDDKQDESFNSANHWWSITSDPLCQKPTTVDISSTSLALCLMVLFLVIFTGSCHKFDMIKEVLM